MTTPELEVSLENAEILMREGMLEDAKHTLFQLRVRDPDSVVVRQKLAELHQKELEILLQRQPEPQVPTPSGFETEKILSSLESELGPAFVEDLARDVTLQNELSRGLKKHTRDWDSRSHLDLGIGLLEMGLASAAIRELELVHDPVLLISSKCLLAQAEILRERPFDAVLILEPLLQESDLTQSARCEVLYLLGRANEKLGNTARAQFWFAAVAELSPTYRDVSDRLS